MRAPETSREAVLPLSADPALRRRFAVLNEPIPGNLRFGLLLEVLDRLAADTALDHARRARPDARVVTAALDEIVVRRVADLAKDLRCVARVNHVGRTSMEVGVRVDQDGGNAHVASCYFTMVARDGDGPDARSIEVPPLEPGRRARARAGTSARVARRAAYRREEESAVEPPSREEFLALARLHRAQEAPGFAGALASALVAETWERTYPEQENLSKVIFGGYIMRRAFELSSICAELDRHAPAGGRRGEPHQLLHARAHRRQAPPHEPGRLHGAVGDLRRDLHRAGEPRPQRAGALELLPLHVRQRGRRRSRRSRSPRSTRPPTPRTPATSRRGGTSGPCSTHTAKGWLASTPAASGGR